MEREMLLENANWNKRCHKCIGRHMAICRVMTIWIGFVLWLLITPSDAKDDLNQPVPMSRMPPAERLLREVISGIPNVPMQIQATIRKRKQGGPVEKRINAEVQLDTDAGVYSAMYTITDAFGGSQEQLIVKREPDRSPQYRYRTGNPLRDSEVPNLYDRVKETDLTWLDIGFSYLWWPEGETTGTERIRGRFCYVVEVPAPYDSAGDFEYVKLWIDPKINMLLQAEAYDVLGDRVRRMSIDSFKKVDGVWFIKDIDIYTYPERSVTSMRVHSLQTLTRDKRNEGVRSPIK